MTNERRGNLWAAASAISSGAFAIPFKVAGGHGLSPLTLAFGLVLGGALFNSMALLSGAGTRRRFDAYFWRVCLQMSVFTALGNGFSSQAVQLLDPAVYQTLIQTQVLFAGLLGWLFLKERVTRTFLLGVVLAVLGIAVMRLPEAHGHALPLLGLLSVGGAAASFTMVHVLTRKHAHNISPLQVNALRLWFAAAVLGAFPDVVGQATSAPPAFWGVIFGAAFLGPFLGRVCVMYSARYIPVAQGILISIASPVVTLMLGWLVLGTTPTGLQLAGGATLLCGVLLPLVGILRAPQTTS